MDWHQVIIRPLVTEKGTRSSTTRNAYPFEVHPEANKIEIKNAVQQIYKEFFIQPLGEKSHHLLHTKYAERSVV